MSKSTFLLAALCISLSHSLSAQVAGHGQLMEILDPQAVRSCETSLISTTTQVALPSIALQEMVRILRHHGANYPLGLSSQGPTENPVLLPKDAIGFMRRFYKAATKQPVSTTRFHFELEATYLASAAGGRHIFEYRASPDMRALVLLTTTSGAGAGDVRMMLVFHELSTGMRLEFEQIFRGRGSYTKIGKEKSNPVEDTGVAYVFGGNTQTTYLGKDRENKLTGTSANIDVSDHFPNKPIKLTFKFYAAN